MNFETLSAVLNKLQRFEPCITEIYLAPGLKKKITAMPRSKRLRAFDGFDIKVFDLTDVFVKAGIQFAILRSDDSFSMYNNFGSCVIDGTSVKLFPRGLGSTADLKVDESVNAEK